MKGLGIIIFIFLIHSKIVFSETTIYHGNSKAKSWSEYTADDKENFKYILSIIETSQTGKKLINMAREKTKADQLEILDVLEVGQGSLTDTTLVRRFSAHDPMDVSYEARSKIILNKHLSIQNAVLDLSHELTHFIFRTPFNPYQKNFSLSGFIESTVQGRGGEVEAFMMECQIFKEVYPDSFRENYNCQKIVDRSGLVNKAMAIKQFYKVGNYLKNFINKLSKNGISPKTFPHVDDDNPVFISSAYGLPYPIAALEEYQSVLSKACDNDKRRMAYVKDKQQRNPASMVVLTQYQEFLNDYNRRCASI